MPKNTRGGKGHKKGKNKPSEEPKDDALILANDDQIYACTLKRLGGSRVSVNCSDGKTRSALIPGKFKRRVWINQDDILLCDHGMNDDSLCYVVYKYSKKEALDLKNKGEINFDVKGDDDANQNIHYADLDEFDDEEEDNHDLNVMVQHNLNRLDLPDSESDNDNEEIRLEDL